MKVSLIVRKGLPLRSGSRSLPPFFAGHRLKVCGERLNGRALAELQPAFAVEKPLDRAPEPRTPPVPRWSAPSPRGESGVNYEGVEKFHWLAHIRTAAECCCLALAWLSLSIQRHEDGFTEHQIGHRHAKNLARFGRRVECITREIWCPFWCPFGFEFAAFGCVGMQGRNRMYLTSTE